MISSLKLALYHNLAAGYLKLNDTQNALKSCEEALALDNNSTKALFRKAKSLTMNINATVEDFKTALKTIIQAIEIDNSDQDI